MMYISQIIMLYALTLYSAVCRLNLNKTGKKTKSDRILYLKREKLIDLTMPSGGKDVDQWNFCTLLAWV